MATTPLPHDFKEFLKLLNSSEVEYLVVGGYAVGHYGYPRNTGDMDVWIAIHPRNAERMVEALRAFGFAPPNLAPSIFLQEERIIRMGVPPFRIEVFTTISGVNFEESYMRHESTVVDDVEVKFIGLDDLKANKLASGRPKDVNDLLNLP